MREEYQRIADSEAARAEEAQRTILLKTALHMFRYNVQQSAVEKKQQERVNQLMLDFQIILENDNYDYKISQAADKFFAKCFDYQQPNVSVFIDAERKWGLKPPMTKLVIVK